MRFFLGSDPEWFVSNGKKPVSIIGKIGGTKDKPLPIPDLGDGYTLQEDNVALEYNTPRTDSIERWTAQHAIIQDYIKTKLKELGLKPLVVGSVNFDDKELADPRAWVFGCDPDFNAWTGEINPKPFSEKQNLRAAGGHIHFGAKYNKLTKLQKVFLVRSLDLHVGMPLMIADPDKERQQLYGRAGAFRYKSYGLEYRTPSNYWTRTRRATTWVAQSVELAFSRFMDGLSVPQDVQIVIDERDLVGARTLMEKYGIAPVS